MYKPVVVVPNWNGEKELTASLNSLKKQTLQAHIIVVDNGSVDGSLALLERDFPDIELIRHSENKGYAGGVNPGFKRAIELGAAYVAPFNNDAVATNDWLEKLVEYLDSHPETGIVACKVVSSDKEHLDSTGEYYTTWGLPFPRGRDETDLDKYDQDTEVFGASGAASLYRVSMLEQIGLLDEDFFAYYEDVDLSFRAQLADWKVAYVPSAVVYHETSTTSNKIKGFSTLQTHKNLPLLLAKNVPRSLLPTVLPRFILAYKTFFFAAARRGQLFYALQGYGGALVLLPKKLKERRIIQSGRMVSDDYIRSILVWDLPPNASKLRKLRSRWRRLMGRPA